MSCFSNQACLTLSREDIQNIISMSLEKGCVREELELSGLLWHYI